MERVIFLVDMNAFFIGCETVRDPSLKGVPAAVAGDPKNRSGIILAANYEARSFGVRTTMTIYEALRLCPSLRLVPPDHEYYEQVSNKVMNTLSSYTPVMEQNSIDEAWLDMTGCEPLFGKPLEAARKIMDDLYSNHGLMCSIGISENKFLAKMASDMKKPMGITEVWKSDIQHKLWPLPVSRMYGIGPQTTIKLNGLGIETIGQLAHFSVGLLVERFGKYGLEIHRLANGIDDSPVKPHGEDEIKSISRSTTLSEDTTDIEYAKRVLLSLADEVGMAARRHGKKGHTVQITIKYSDFKSITRQTKISPTCLTRDIYEAGRRLLETNWDIRLPVRLLGIGLSGFEEDEQISIFEDLAGHRDAREEILERTADRIRHKHGWSILKPASLLQKNDTDH
ncbi:MAG TPA: DNA polymerase IV [Candidatus Atribacteria bacterium]|nr:DNA polymerase IV [Candidatus Atribacteria bacterium]HPT78263.1 DNA polymerase IV [Candidatus Atribacteria bacterium]